MASEVAKLAIAGSDESVFSRAFRWLRRALSSPVEETALTIGASQVPRDYPADYPQNTVTPPDSLEKEDGTSRRPPMASNGVPVEYREVPSISFTEWDRVPEIRSILRELEQGYFQRASLLSVLQERDDRIAGTWATRINTLLGTPLEFEPALIDGYVTEQSAEVADAAEVDWPLIFPEGSLDRLFKQGVDVGLSVGELIVREDEETGRWVPHLKTWHSQWVWWNWGTESYWLNTSGAYDADGNPLNDGAGVIELPRIDRNVYSDGHWVVYTPFGYRYAFQRGLIRATSMLHLKRQWDFRDWARYNEVYGLLIRIARVPSGASEPDKTRFANSIRNLGSEAMVEAPFDETGKGFDVEIRDAGAGTGNATFGASLHYLDECIGNVILGQSAAGEKKTGLGDGQANQDEAVRQDVLERDAKSLYGALRQQVLTWWTEWNFGDKRLTPTPHALIQSQEEEARKTSSLKNVADAAQSIKTAWPNADMEAIAAEHSIPLLQPGQVSDDPAIQLPTGAPSGDDVRDEEQPAANDDEVKREQLRALTAKRRKRPPTYADRLSAEATAHGARIMAPDVKDILRIIREANGPEELKAALVAKYRSMNPEALADLVERAQVMAALAGRSEVLEKL